MYKGLITTAAFLRGRGQLYTLVKDIYVKIENGYTDRFGRKRLWSLRRISRNLSSSKISAGGTNPSNKHIHAHGISAAAAGMSIAGVSSGAVNLHKYD